MTREDQSILASVIDLLRRTDSRRDARHAASIRRQLRAAIDTVVRLEAAEAKAERRGRELRARDAAARRIYSENVGRGVRILLLASTLTACGSAPAAQGPPVDPRTAAFTTAGAGCPAWTALRQTFLLRQSDPEKKKVWDLPWQGWWGETDGYRWGVGSPWTVTATSGSAWRWRSLHSPPSLRKTCVARSTSSFFCS